MSLSQNNENCWWALMVVNRQFIDDDMGSACFSAQKRIHLWIQVQYCFFVESRHECKMMSTTGFDKPWFSNDCLIIWKLSSGVAVITGVSVIFGTGVSRDVDWREEFWDNRLRVEEFWETKIELATAGQLVRHLLCPLSVSLILLLEYWTEEKYR